VKVALEIAASLVLAIAFLAMVAGIALGIFRANVPKCYRHGNADEVFGE